jgi:cyclophilin family peptidyl-prolyl cis-trans isomerase
MIRRVSILLGLIILTGIGCAPAGQEDLSLTFEYPDNTEEETTMPTWKFPGVLPSDQIEGKQVRIATEKGEIVFELFADTAPKTVSNFVYLSEGGYYNGLTFHRREEGFVIQGGDPSGNGSGGPGYAFEDELDDSYRYERGIVAMANRGPDTNGSQFFIMLDDTPLPKSYSIFGRVVSGMEVVDAIVVGDAMITVTVENNIE